MTRKLIVLLVLVASPAWAQERLQTILDRGHVSEWLVCGPFDPGPGAIVEAVRNGTPPLGEVDYMAPAGGISRVRPREGLEVPTATVPREWTAQRANEPVIDLTATFSGYEDGVVYLAFACLSKWSRIVYVDLQTPLGARVWLNGFPVRKIRPADLTGNGLDRFIAEFRIGANHFVMEVPLASLQRLSTAVGAAPAELRDEAFENRPLIDGTNGFTVAMRLRPVDMVGGLAYVPVLEPTGTFSTENGVIHQDVRLTVFNPGETATDPIRVETSVEDSPGTVQQAILPVPPKTQKEVILSVPTGALPPGQPFQAQVSLEVGRASDSFTNQLNAAQAPEEGKVYMVTGGHYAPGAGEDQSARVERRMREIVRNLVFMDSEPHYGMFLGYPGVWRPFVEANPGMRQELADAIGASRCGMTAAYAPLDERIVCGELLVRNLAYGHYVNTRHFGTAASAFWAWDAPAVCPQTPQLLDAAPVDGILSDLAIGGLDPLFLQRAPNGATALHRHKNTAGQPRTVEDLRKTAHVQRRELHERGFPADVFVHEGTSSPPEPFFAGESENLRKARPSIRVTGAGADMFLREAHQVIAAQDTGIPETARLMTTAKPGELLAQAPLKQAHSRTEDLVGTAEHWASFASLLGARYPSRALDYAWRQLLYSGRHDRVGFSESPADYLDALAACRESAALASGIIRDATRFLAERVNVYPGMPSTGEGIQTITVFNRSAFPRNGVCDALVTPSPQGHRLTDAEGNPVPFEAEQVRRPEDGARLDRIRFVAKQVPASGYTTFYLEPEGHRSAATEEQGNTIENEFFHITIEPAQGGAITRLVDKESGKEHARERINDIVLLEEAAALNNGGLELWTTPALTRASAAMAQVEKTVSPVKQRLTLTSAFAGGRLIREITLYSGVRRIDCTARVEGVSLEGRMLAAVHQTWGNGAAPVYGERYGAVVGRDCMSVFDMQTAGETNPSGTAVQPALRWAALSPNDRIEAGGDIAVALKPCMVIHPREPRLNRAARKLFEAFSSRGIPCTMSSDQPPRRDPIWSDATYFNKLDDDLRHGAGMRVLVGGPEHNAFTRSLLLDEVPEDEQFAVTNKLLELGVLFFYSSPPHPNVPPVPTLIIGGLTPEQVERDGVDMAEALEATGILAIPPEAYLPTQGRPLPATGIAALHHGTKPCNADTRGVLLVGLAHPGKWRGDPDRLGIDADAGPHEFEYALYPFAGDWRQARVAQAAQAYSQPFDAVVLAPHVGTDPPTQSYLQVEQDNFIVTAVKPSGYRQIDSIGGEVTARNGITVRGYECNGMPGHITLASFAPLRNAGRLNLLGMRVASVRTQDRNAYFETGAYDVESLLLLPATGLPRDETAGLGEGSAGTGPVFTRYWRHNLGAAPPGFQPLSVLLDGEVTGSEAAIMATVANNTVDQTIRGELTLSAPAGWDLAPIQFPYELKPGEFIRKKIIVLRQAAESSRGAIKAKTLYQGKTYQDVLGSREEELTLEVRRNGRETVVIVRNRGKMPAEGRLDLIVPPGFWPEFQGNFGPGVVPAKAEVRVPPFEEQRFVFYRIGSDDPPWTVARLGANGHTLYRAAGTTGGPPPGESEQAPAITLTRAAQPTP